MTLGVQGLFRASKIQLASSEYGWPGDQTPEKVPRNREPLDYRKQLLLRMEAVLF